MHFAFIGFVSQMEFRLFRFERIDRDMSRSEFTVRADLSLIRKYGIQMQDLPQLCNALLADLDHDEGGRAFLYGEDAMRGFAEQKAAEKDKANRKNAARRAPLIGAAKSPWRASGGLGPPSSA